MGNRGMAGIRYKRISGLTLVELAVAVAIVSVLMGLAAMAVGRARRAAHSTACASSLRQLAIVLEQYASDTGCHLPAFFGTGPAYRYNYPVDVSHWPDVLVARGWASPDVFLCPASARRGNIPFTPVNLALNGNAAGFAQPLASMGPSSYENCGPGISQGFAIGAGDLISADRIRRPGETVWVVDAAAGTEKTCRWEIGFRYWTENSVYLPFAIQPDDHPSNPSDDAAARHNGKANVAFFDGHVASFPGGRSYTAAEDGIFLHWDGEF